VLFAEAYPFTTATFTRAISQEASQTHVGFHLGGDVAWFFTRHLGVSATIRFTRANATLTTPAGGAVPVHLGGLETTAGFRVALGGTTDTRRPVASPPQPVTPGHAADGTPPARPLSAPPAPAAAPAPTRQIAVTKGDVPAFVQPNFPTPITVFPEGTKLVVLEVHGDWLEVVYQDTQYGRRVVFVERRLVTLTPP